MLRALGQLINLVEVNEEKEGDKDTRKLAQHEKKITFSSATTWPASWGDRVWRGRAGFRSSFDPPQDFES
jgi:hypothetical protein